MPPFFIRSTVFNILFYALTGLACILLLPTLFLPRKAYLFVVHGFVHSADFLAKYILGLDYEVRGRENIPESGAYIVAAKHQSAYETLKLHILFDDPAVVLKKELLSIPLWGKYLAKSDVIAIDRSSPKMAIRSIQDGAKEMAARGRPMIIFPQGTRVAPEQTATDKPYKIGIVRMQEAAKVPIIPLALNTGIFWPRNSWVKKPGKVIFEFLPAVKPAKSASETLKELETVLEKKSNALMEEGRKSVPKAKSLWLMTGGALFVLVLAYTLNWFIVADRVRHTVTGYLQHLNTQPGITVDGDLRARTSGFPGRVRVSVGKHTISTADGSVLIESLQAQGWPFPGMPIEIEGRNIALSMPHWTDPLKFASLDATVEYHGDILTVLDSSLKQDSFEGSVTGDIDFSQTPYPGLDLDIALKEHEPLLQDMISKNVVKANPAMLAGMALEALKKDGVVNVSLRRHEDGLYLGPIKIAALPGERANALAYQQAPRRKRVMP